MESRKEFVRRILRSLITVLNCNQTLLGKTPYSLNLIREPKEFVNRILSISD